MLVYHNTSGDHSNAIRKIVQYILKGLTGLLFCLTNNEGSRSSKGMELRITEGKVGPDICIGTKSKQQGGILDNNLAKKDKKMKKVPQGIVFSVAVVANTILQSCQLLLNSRKDLSNEIIGWD